MATQTALRPGEIKDILLREIEAADLADLNVEEVGSILEVKDGIARVYGLGKVMAGEMLEFTASETKAVITGMALNLEEDNIGAIILGDYLQLKEGDEVRRTARVLEVPVGPELIGRVVDPLGRPIDGLGDIRSTAFRKVESPAPGIIVRQPVKEPLLKAIREGRLAQAYLFSGPRGVGKTTTARLLAMAVGCQGEDPPCGVCPHCQAVQRGAHPDVVEIDAASNNSVEDVRELRERIHLAPLSAPRKVFILDEAHMLSKSAFNALLKTLEEPPPHVLFVFATTEPERMPPTILSRTQHFRFRRLTEEEIAFKLRRILEAVGREAEEEALLLLARLLARLPERPRLRRRRQARAQGAPAAHQARRRHQGCPHPRRRPAARLQSTARTRAARAHRR